MLISLRGLGYRPDPTHRRTQKDARLHPLLAPYLALPKLPLAMSLERFEAPIFDQDGTGSCIGHGTAQILVTACKSHGIPLGFVPSPHMIYGATMAVERAAATPPGSQLPPLADNGAMPSDVATMLASYGVAPMTLLSPDGRFSDVTPGNVCDEPDLAALEKAGRTIVTGEYRIQESTAQTGTQMAAAITAGIPIGVGAFVDTAFMRWQKGMPAQDTVNMNDANGGGHWFAVTSYRYANADDIALGVPAGTLIFRGPNSWGTPPDYGDNGHFEVTENWLRQTASDLYVFDVKIAAKRSP